MDAIYRFLYNPFTFTYDSDRKRRIEPSYYGIYKPSKLKRFMVWIMNDKIDPVDWEEVPPFVEHQEEGFFLQLPRDATIHPYECLTQPNMLTQENIYMRRFIIFGFLVLFNRLLIKRKDLYHDIYGFRAYYRFSMITKLLIYAWSYYLICNSFANLQYQLPYN